MDNSLAKYLGRDLKGAIAELQVVQGTARDSGNTYYAVEISFVNGYKKRLYLKSDEQFAWTNAFDMLETTKQIEIQ